MGEVIGGLQENMKQYDEKSIFETGSIFKDSELNKEAQSTDESYMEQQKKSMDYNKYHTENMARNALEEAMMSERQADNILLEAMSKGMGYLSADMYSLKNGNGSFAVSDPPVYRLSDIRRKKQEKHIAARLKAEYLAPLNARRQTIKSKLTVGRLDKGETAEGLNKELELIDQAIRAVPEFDNVTDRFRVNAIAYNTSNDITKYIKLGHEPETDDEDHRKTIEDMVRGTTTISFDVSLCDEDYMASHYSELRHIIDQCIALPELMKREKRTWDGLSDDDKQVVKHQAEKAEALKKVFMLYGKKHNVDTDSGDFIAEPFEKQSEYELAVKEYQKQFT